MLRRWLLEKKNYFCRENIENWHELSWPFAKCQCILWIMMAIWTMKCAWIDRIRENYAARVENLLTLILCISQIAMIASNENVVPVEQMPNRFIMVVFFIADKSLLYICVFSFGKWNLLFFHHTLFDVVCNVNFKPYESYSRSIFSFIINLILDAANLISIILSVVNCRSTNIPTNYTEEQTQYVAMSSAFAVRKWQFKICYTNRNRWGE